MAAVAIAKKLSCALGVMLALRSVNDVYWLMPRAENLPSEAGTHLRSLVSR